MSAKGKFLRYLRKSLKNEPNHDQTVFKKIESEFAKVFDVAKSEVNSKADISHLKLACLVYAAYQVLQQSSISQSAIMNALQDAVSKPNQNLIELGISFMLKLSKDPMKSLTDYCSNKIPYLYGDAFEFEESGSAADSYTLEVRKCLYADFFQSKGVPSLTQLFCEWDQNWIKPISPEKHGVKFIRATTLASGGESCPFTFKRV